MKLLIFFTFRELVSCSKQTQHSLFWKYFEFVTSCFDATNTSAAFFFLISCVREFVDDHMLQTQPPDFWHKLVTSRVRVLRTQQPDFWHELVTSCVANTTACFLALVRDFVSSCVANTTALVSITNLMNACCC